MATTASYQASVEGLVAGGLRRRAQARRLITLSVTIARDVRDELAETTPGLLVAASVGPYGACLADGSEYTGRYDVPRCACATSTGPGSSCSSRPAPDLLAVETIPDADEAEVLVALLDEVGLPAWFSDSRGGTTTTRGNRCGRRTTSWQAADRSSRPASTAQTRPMCSVP